MKTLKLTLNKKWFDLIKKGIKTEEYREIKQYWQTRLQINGYHRFEFKKFDFVEFTNGYNKNSPQITVECLNILIGQGLPEWGAVEGQEYFILPDREILATIKQSQE
jgi:hypothetical protein